MPDSSFWNLTLTAYKSATDTGTSPIKYKDGADEKDASDPVLIGKASPDLRSGAAKITFNMGVGNLTTPGSIEISTTATYADAKKAVKKVVFALYNDVGEKQYITDAITVPTSSASPRLFVSDAKTFEDKDAASNKSNIAPGEYKFGIWFYGDDTTSDIGYWQDTIVIAPGQKTIFDKIVPNVISLPPVEPTSFAAQLVKDSETTDAYNVKLTWTDVPDNETNFELAIFEIKTASKTAQFAVQDVKDVFDATSTPKATDKATLVALLGNSVTNSDATNFAESPYYVTGSLFAGSETVTISLETGKLYEVVLRARNTSGASEWVERTTVPTAKLDSGNTGYAIAGTGSGVYAHVNRTLFYYSFRGARMYYDASTSYKDTSYTTYATYTGADLALIKKVMNADETAIDTSSSDIVEYADLASGKYAFTTTDSTPSDLNFKKWVPLATDPETYESTDAVTKATNGYENVFVKAVFTTETTIKTYKYYDIDTTVTTIAVTGDKGGARSKETTGDNAGVYVEPASAESHDKTITIKLTEAADPNITGSTHTYSKYRVYVGKHLETQLAYDSSKTEYSCTLYTSDFNAGNYSVTFEAYREADKTWYSVPLVIQIKH